MSLLRRFTSLLLTVFGALLASACADTLASDHEVRTVGYTCGSDGDCADGLMCKQIAEGAPGACRASNLQCTRGCTADADCRATDANGRCITDCEGHAVCVIAAFGGTAGEPCDESRRCKEGLSCRPLVVSDGAESCKIAAQVCSTSCNKDADCATLGADFRCLGCGEPPSSCGLIR